MNIYLINDVVAKALVTGIVGWYSRGHCFTNFSNEVTKNFSGWNPIFSPDYIYRHDIIKIVGTVSLNTYIPIRIKPC